MGRLEQFVNIGTNCFKSTGVKYFLSFWRQEDGGLKSYFVNPENYEHVGILNTNYKLHDEFLNKI